MADDYLLRIQVAVQNDKSLTALTQQLQRANKAAAPVQKRMKETTVATRNFGQVAQNVGYQVQDLAVQIQGGVDPLRAMAQQLPQMAVGFGALGAAIGTAVALLPSVVTLFKEAEVATVDIDEAVSGLQVTLDNFDMSGFIEQFNEATEVQRRTLEQMLRNRLQIAREAQQALETSLTGPAGDMIGGGFGAAESLGLPVDVFARNIQLIQQFSREGASNLEVLSQMRDLYLETRDAQGGLSENGQQYLNNLFKLERAISATAEAQQAYNAAVEAGATGRIPTELLQEVEVLAQRREALLSGGGGGGGAATGDNLGFDTGVFAAEELDRWVHTMYEVIEATEQVPEAFSLAAEGAEIFQRSFENALMGVAQGTQDLSSAVKNMVTVILVELGKLASYQFLANAFAGTAFGNAAASLLPSAKGNVFDQGNLVPFANGGIVNRPTVFPMANGAGLMGEAGPEAILPLKRNRRGQLGVQSDGMQVVVNNNAPGVAVEPRQTESGLTIDVVMAQVAASIDRGGNPISNAIEQNYNVGRGRGVY